MPSGRDDPPESKDLLLGPPSNDDLGIRTERQCLWENCYTQRELSSVTADPFDSDKRLASEPFACAQDDSALRHPEVCIRTRRMQ